MPSIAKALRAATPLVAGVSAVAMLALTGCGSGGASDDGPKQTAPQTVTIVTTTTTETTTTTALTPVVPPPSSPNEVAFFVMPDVVGKVLQDAQDELQRVSCNPMFYTSSTDATGQGRRQILDRNWIVCSQSVPAGTQVAVVDGPTISFAAVKRGESCP